MKKQKTIAVVIDPDWPLKRHHEVIGGIQEYAEDRGGWNLVIDLFPEAFIERYDGVVGRITGNLAQQAAEAGIPVVNTWVSSPVAEEVPSVLPDFAKAARMAADHLASRGFKTFAYVGFTYTADRLFRDAFMKHLRKAGFRCRSILLSDQYHTNKERWLRFNVRLENWFNSLKTPIGICSRVGPIDRHLLTICKQEGVSVPHDVALISDQNEPGFCLMARPTITSIDDGYTEIGRRAAELLDNLLKGKKPPAEPILMPPAFLEVRESTDAFVVKDPLVAEALRFIAENAHKAIKVEDVARVVGYGRRTLELRFRKGFEKTVAQTIEHFKIERLKRLLVQTDRTLKDLSIETGFKDAHMMYTAFNRIEGISPSEYRRQHGTLDE